MPWQPAASPLPPLPPGEAREYRDAYLSPYSVRRSTLPGDTVRYVSGAVYADGDLVAASQRSGGHIGDFVRSADPARTVPPRDVQRLRGRWLYGGHWMGQFGHFLTETLTTLWPQRGREGGVVFHRFISPPEIQRWQTELLGMAGWDVPVRVLDEDVVVDRLLVPTRPFVINLTAGPEAVLPWDRVRFRVHGDSRPVFLSRSALTDDPRRMPGDEDLDRLFEKLGLRIVRPETLGVREQAAAVARASAIVAVSGSHLHLSALAGPGARVVEIGDRRTRNAPVPNQLVVDAVRGHRTAFVPLLCPEGMPDVRDAQATADAVAALLEQA